MNDYLVTSTSAFQLVAICFAWCKAPRTVNVKNNHRSKFSNWKEEAWKNQGFNGIRTCDLHDTNIMRCSTNWAMKPHIGSEVNLKVKSDHRSQFSNLSNWKEEAWKKSGLQWDSNLWPPRYQYTAMLYQLSYMYEATYWEQGQFIEFPWGVYTYEIIRILNCSCRWKWRVSITVNFPI